MTATSTISPPAERLATRTEPEPFAVRFQPPPPWKRAIDVVGSLCLLVLLSPIFALIAIYIKSVSRGPFLFQQERIGAGALPFVILKFRTMEVDHDGDSHRDYVAELARSGAPASKPSYQKCLIRGGEFLRSVSLDELPQLFNVLMGNMSLVGPRPEVLQLEDYQPWQLRRFEVLPGISGLWQVSGKNRLTFNQMIELDIRYVDELSFGLDARIMFRTLRVVVTRSNH